MAKLITALIALSFVLIIPVSGAQDSNVIETIPAKIRSIDVMLVPACQNDDFKDVCLPNVIKEEKTIEEWVGKNNVAKFIARNKLDPKTHNANTIIPKGIVLTIK